MPWQDKESWRTVDDDPSGKRFAGKSQQGFQGNHVDPNPYMAHHGGFSNPPMLPNGVKFSVDIPNLNLNYQVANGPGAFPGARNASWSNLIEAIRDVTAEMGTTIGEWPKSLEMIAHRATRLRRGYQHLRKGAFRKFLKEFAIGPKPKHRNKVRNAVNEASNLWLEYSFGWSPLLKDIYNACTAFNAPLSGGEVSGSGSASFNEDVQSGLEVYEYRCRVFVKQGATVYVSNPNMYALQQVGLANPLSIVWELVPFSFMVDWVFDVGSFLGSLTDLLGCTVLRPYTVVYGKGKVTLKIIWPPTGEKFSQWGHTFACQRSIGLSQPTPNLDFSANIGTSLNRAANAVSLLGQILTK